jgi:hypothetical protein
VVSTQALVLPPLYCPIEPSVHPECAMIETKCIEWIDEHRLYTSSAARSKLIATKAAVVYSMALAEAPAERVVDVAKWLYWGFATDDLVYDNGPTSLDAGVFLPVAARYVRMAEEPRARFEVEPPYSSALRELVADILRHATAAQRADWANTARGWFFGMAWDVAHADAGYPPSINEYLMMRMHTGGLASWIATLDIAMGVNPVPADVQTPSFRALVEVWSTMCLLINDFMSFPKEVSLGDSSSNIVKVVASERGTSQEDALAVSYEMYERLAKLFVVLVEQVRPAVGEESRQRIRALEASWRGIIEWGFSSSRYTHADEGSVALVQHPGVKASPDNVKIEPLEYPAVSWWWEEVK